MFERLGVRSFDRATRRIEIAFGFGAVSPIFSSFGVSLASAGARSGPTLQSMG